MQDAKEALAAKETERAEAAAQLERRMAAMEAVLAARRTPVAEAKPEAARGPGADLRFQVQHADLIHELALSINVDGMCIAVGMLWKCAKWIYSDLYMYTAGWRCNSVRAGHGQWI